MTSQLETKYTLILEHERRLARAVAYAAIPPARLTVWDVMIPFVFITNHLKQKQRRQLFVRNFLFTKTLALDAARTIAHHNTPRNAALDQADTKTRDVLKQADQQIYSDTIRTKQMAEIKLLTDHYHGLLAAQGETYEALVVSAYPDKAAYLNFLKTLQTAETAVIQAAQQFLGHRSDTVMLQRIEHNSIRLRQRRVDRIFGDLKFEI